MKTNEHYRPKAHYTSEYGWINDPNGFSVYKNRYHLFAQHNPYDTKWGPMHWSHAVSDDFIKWERLPIALEPTEEYERDLGCFSGTALEYEGKHILMYTGCRGSVGEPVEQEQCIAIGNGIKYEKSVCNPVIGVKDLPNFVKTSDFRDPKIFRNNNYFYCLIGAQVVDTKVGTMLLYKSIDLEHWTYVGETLRAKEDGSMGIVFECPDLFKCGDKYVILTSPIEMPRQGEKYNNLSSSVYFVGDMDFENGKFTVEYYDEIDGGFDFYAPQTLEDLDGNRVMIAWAQMWERNFITDQLTHGWAGAMTLPRTLSLQNNKLLQQPVLCIENYHSEFFNDIREGSQDLFRMQVEIDLAEGNEFALELLKTSAGSFKVIYDKSLHKLIIDRSQSLFKLDRHKREDGINNRRSVSIEENQNLYLDIIVDKSQIEIFVNNGEKVLTSNYYVGKDAISSEIITDYAYKFRKYNLNI